MYKRYAFIALLLLNTFSLFSQAKLVQPSFWVGSGTDTSYLYIDFLDSSWDSSYVWGYLHNGAQAGQMLSDIAAVDANLTVNLGGGFLNDIIYHKHSGIAGTPNYWGTWSAVANDSFRMNSGIGDTLTNGEIFGCSYTDFNPAVAPGTPIPAYNPSATQLKDAEVWYGSGSDSALIIIDFLVDTADAFFWGILFDDSISGEDALTLLDEEGTIELSIAGGFLNDIEFLNFKGIGGSPNFWGTWSATNVGNWDFNSGIGTTIRNGDFFGASYTDFSPALRPRIGVPVASIPNTLNDNLIPSYTIYPNPASTQLFVKGVQENSSFEIFDRLGRKMMQGELQKGKNPLNVSSLHQGIYLLRIGEQTREFVIQ